MKAFNLYIPLYGINCTFRADNKRIAVGYARHSFNLVARDKVIQVGVNL
jgi:hypothetical protein